MIPKKTTKTSKNDYLIFIYLLEYNGSQFFYLLLAAHTELFIEKIRSRSTSELKLNSSSERDSRGTKLKLSLVLSRN